MPCISIALDFFCDRGDEAVFGRAMDKAYSLECKFMIKFREFTFSDIQKVKIDT